MSSNGKVAIYAGAFDPFTSGHLDIVKRALAVFDEIVILVAVSPNKKSLLDPDERVQMVKEVFSNHDSVSVDHFSGLVVDYAQRKKINHLIRGLRPTGDFESEFQMATMNNKLDSNIETVFFMTGEQYFYISSSLVKEIHLHGGDVSNFVPPEVNKRLTKS